MNISIVCKIYTSKFVIIFKYLTIKNKILVSIQKEKNSALENMTILLFMKKKNGSNVSNTYKLFIMWGYRKVLDPFSKISPTDKTDFFFFSGLFGQGKNYYSTHLHTTFSLKIILVIFDKLSLAVTFNLTHCRQRKITRRKLFYFYNYWLSEIWSVVFLFLLDFTKLRLKKHILLFFIFKSNRLKNF